MDIICKTETCAEYLIRKELDVDLDPATINCGTCGEPMTEDDGTGVAVEDRPNPEEPLVLPDPAES